MIKDLCKVPYRWLINDNYSLSSGAVRSILNTLDRDSILKQAKGDIINRLKAGM